MRRWPAGGIKTCLSCWVVALMWMPLAGCSLVTPHENFRLIHDHVVGKSIDLPPRAIKAYPEDLISTTVLPSGNIENQYQFRGTCRYFYEVNPKTRIIMGWRFEGSERDCEIVP